MPMASKRINFIFPLVLFLTGLLFAVWSGCAGPQPLPKQRARAIDLDRKGAEFFHQGQYAKALSFFQKSLQVNESIDNREGVALSLNNMGTVHQSTGEYVRALDCYQRALTINSEIGNPEGQSLNLNNIGSVTLSLGKPQAALEFFQKSLTLEEKRGETESSGDPLEQHRFSVSGFGAR